MGGAAGGRAVSATGLAPFAAAENRRWVLARRPRATVDEDCFRLEAAPVPEPSAFRPR